MPLGANKAAIMGVAGVSTGDVVLIQSQTATSDASLSFTSGIDSTYGEYIFKFYNIGPESDAAYFSMNFSTDGGSNYNMTKTSTYFKTLHTESNDTALVAYDTGWDNAEATGVQFLIVNNENDADSACAGELHLFNPSSTTYVKHWYSRFSAVHSSPAANDNFSAGYINSTSDVDAVQFKWTSGDFDGTIKMWGVK